ncbi:MAG: hypothetical protein EB141_15410 [Verrucomicrobia bacterium]|nr:hypothetical protein [Pseudomonadota bacterium]NDA68217.1 hypothetical protein [Verrucomicrobiota bacterium]NDB77003.1 hypothetical protein [Verrucomicrobiota bacterium]NDD40033.1 hypothetical protein [Verrucomicrobiota bacterium]
MEAGAKQHTINGMHAKFDGRSACIFTDRTFDEVYADDGISNELRKPQLKSFPPTETKFTAA